MSDKQYFLSSKSRGDQQDNYKQSATPSPLPPRFPTPTPNIHHAMVPPPHIHQTSFPQSFIRSQYQVPPPQIPPPHPRIPPPPTPPSLSIFPPQHKEACYQPITQTFQEGSGSLYPASPWFTLPQTYQAISQPLTDQEDSLDSQKVVNGWLKKKGITEKTKEVPVRNNTKIYDVKSKFNSAFNLIKELENGARTLSVMAKTVTPAEWDSKCTEIEEKKKQLIEILNKLNLSEEEVKELKEKCSKRSKKRSRLRRQAERRKIKKEEEKIRNQNINFQINNWQREMQEAVERTQTEEELQREADAVLWGVTHKTVEAKRQVALLSALLELRQVRVQRQSAAGKPASQLQIDTFNTVIERLKKMWTKQLDQCLLEEQALRGMLSDAEVKNDPVKTYKKLVLQEWESVLFGSVGTLDSNLTGDELIDTRRGWDQFAVPGHSMLSSTVPPGWVLPAPPSTDHWRTLLKY